MAQTVKNLPTKQETWVQSLGWEDPLEKGTGTHSRIPAREIPWTEELGGLHSMGYTPWGYKRVRHDVATKQQQQQNRPAGFLECDDLVLLPF